VYSFSRNETDGDETMKSSLGGKGAYLAQMAKIGLNVPPGFTISTEACETYHQNDGQLPVVIWEQVKAALLKVEKDMGNSFGDASDPLLLSVRSGAAVSMPGMMDTVLNLGLNDQIVEGLAKMHGERFAFDAYRRFLDMFADVVLGVPHSLFEAKISDLKQKRGVTHDVELNEKDLRGLVETYKGIYKEAGVSFPEDPMHQLQMAVVAVFKSWESERAVKYREVSKITGLKGTAVNVQTMVFGNMGATSGTGVLFTRNPISGAKEIYGEYLLDAQGEDVVAGIRTPQPFAMMKKALPDSYNELVKNCKILEDHFQDMMDIEFTIQENSLFMLQCRSGKRTGLAAVTVAVDMVSEGLASKERAVSTVNACHLEQLLHPRFADDQSYKARVLTKGLAASPGAAVGQIVFTAQAAEAWHNAGKQVLLLRNETSPEDVGGMWAAEGVVTARGGTTSHAAVVARGWGKPCVCGASELQIDAASKKARVRGATFEEGAWMSIDGLTGEVIEGQVEVCPPAISGHLETVLGWADEASKVRALANADTPADAVLARSHGARGIGLCRTEHMFFSSPQRLLLVRKMIMAHDEEARRAALDELLPHQQADFEGILEAMDGLSVTVRLLDPPLHEFLPAEQDMEAVKVLADALGYDAAEVVARIAELGEVNPMLGFRGCRLGIKYPEITRMQVRALMQAALSLRSKGKDPRPWIMVPLVGMPAELEHQYQIINEEKANAVNRCPVGGEAQKPFTVPVGTMIELPRAALMAGEIAKFSDFFSFGTNDLTQMTYGFSRDDINKFLPAYKKLEIITKDPFETIDVDGVGQLIRMAAKEGRTIKPDLDLGVCGEHGGDPASIKFFSEVGLNKISCSPMRVPVARLAAAHAAIDLKKL